GGSNWLPIETLTETQWLDSGSHSYTWTVPNPPAETNDCRVKVTLLGAGEETLVSQQSLNDFTIIPEPVSVTTVGYPNGGEEIWAGSTPEITWSAPREAEKFKLQYSTDNGATWILIAKDLTETTYPWPLPTQNGNKAQCLVKVTAYTSSNAVVGSDVSDGPFAIQTLKLVAPSDPGHILTAYDTYPIVWDTYGHKTLPTKVKLDYSKDGGITWQPIVALTDGKSVGSGVHSYMWEVPNPPVDKTKCKARVTLLGAGGVVLGRDQSLNNFTIVAVPVTINSPNGGESIWAGSSYSITWSAPSKAEKFKLQYSVDNGTTWKTISDTVTSTSHLWSIPTQNGNRTQCKVKVTAYTASGGLVGSDTSDKPFAIQVLELTAPTESGLTLIAGEYYSITWETQGLKTPPQKVKLQYSKDGGLTWLPIETVTLAGLPGADPGSSYNWLVPDLGATPKTKCKVKVTLIGAGGVALGNDKSDNNFTISREK
ncbi:MAG: hypothetical protein M1358_12865, partial [Chloroflexi bacterium]|nr:hypothetical protein [Chloroflexota bacterium]